jgi:hypothetical protein
MRLGNRPIILSRCILVKGWIGRLGNLNFCFQSSTMKNAKEKMEKIRIVLVEVEALEVSV